MTQLKIIITFIFSFSVTLVFSQDEDWKKSFFERAIKRIPFIIDGTVIDAKSYKTEENGPPASGGLFQRFDSIDAMYNKIESFGHTRLECPQKPEKNKE